MVTTVESSVRGEKDLYNEEERERRAQGRSVWEMAGKVGKGHESIE